MAFIGDGKLVGVEAKEQSELAVELLQGSLAELQGQEDVEYDPSVVHVFVVLGASVSTSLQYVWKFS